MTFSIVHVSDLHFKNDYPCLQRIRALRDDILKQISRKRTYLIFSGDLVNAGDDDLYDKLLDEFFVPLDDSVQKFYTVPGNHDIQRKQTDKNQASSFAADGNQSYLYTANTGLTLTNPFQRVDPLSNYNALQNALRGASEESYFGYVDIHSDFSFVGLNSAWLSYERAAGQTDQGKLKIDPAIVDYFSKRCPQSGLKVCAFHHPLEWISENVRQDVQNLIASNFDLVLFGHVHNPASSSGTFNEANCLFLQAPAVKSDYSFGANAYSIINVDGESCKYEIIYRTFSEPQKTFVIGEEIAASGRRYPSSEDKLHWERLKSNTKSGLWDRLVQEYRGIDFGDWYNTHIIAKNKQSGAFVEPNVTRVNYSDGAQVQNRPKKLASVIDPELKIQFIMGPQDSGLTTAAFLTLNHICNSSDTFLRVPVYVDLRKDKINKASLINAAVKSSPVKYSHSEMSRLIDEGAITFIFDQIGIYEINNFNNLIKILRDYFPTSNAIIFCTTDGGDPSSEEPSELLLSPTTDVIHELQPFDVQDIEELIKKHAANRKPQELTGLLNKVVASFKQMDEPLYPSSVVVLLETLQQIPAFRPINRVRLFDRYVECLLGRYKIEDVQEGTFNSSDKSNFLAYFAGYLTMHSIGGIPVNEWNTLCRSYEEEKLFELPEGLLNEFTLNGILIQQRCNITFRADYLYSYFVAKEMHQNERVFRFVSEEDAFYKNHKELVFYGELEGVNNKKLLEATHRRLQILETEIVNTYKARGIDFDEEWRNLLIENNNQDQQKFIETIIAIQDAAPSSESLSQARMQDLNGVERARGIEVRQTIKQLESRWLVALKTYFQLTKHSANLSGDDKLKHLKKAMASSELFMKGIAAKRYMISTSPYYYYSGIIYVNPLAESDPERSKRDFKFAVPQAVSRIIGDLMTNPQLSLALRRMIREGSEITRYLVRHLLLEMPSADNRKTFVEDLKESKEIVLQTCSISRLGYKYLGYSIDDESKTFYEKTIDDITKNQKIKKLIPKQKLKKQRLIADMKKNWADDSRS